VSPTVAALYVDPNGVYAALEDVEVWDEARDARLYDGPHPVVAHPPCKRWSKLGACRGYYDGQDAGCFEAALRAVRTYGGVLEHPAYSLAWKRYGLARPPERGWARSMLDDGWTCQVDQGRYGHECRKLTWLYYVGPSPPTLVWGDGGMKAVRVNDAGSASNPHRRSRTPEKFRDALLNMALDVRRGSH